MSWFDRLREAAYTSPKGTRFTFLYEDVSRQLEKRTQEYDFPGYDGSAVIDMGSKARKYPLSCIFTGENCDIEADTFAQALLEIGQGVLEHPRWGRIDAIPFGEINQRDNLKTGANQSIVEVTFWEIKFSTYTAPQITPSKQAINSLALQEQASAQEYSDIVNQSELSTSEQLSLKDKYRNVLQTVRQATNAVRSQVGAVYDQYEEIEGAILGGIDTLIGDPLKLAFEVSVMIKAPFRATDLALDKLQAYSNLSSTTLSSLASTRQSINRSSQLAVATDAKVARDVVAGIVETNIQAISDGVFKTRAQAIQAADLMLNLHQRITNEIESSYLAISETDVEQTTLVDVGTSVSYLEDAVNFCAIALVKNAFQLRSERRITLDRNSSVIAFVAKYYDDIDSNLDDFILLNNLTNAEIIELPAGKQVVVHV